MLNALSSDTFRKFATLFSLRNGIAVLAVTALMLGGYSYSDAQARGGQKGYSSGGHGGGKPRMRSGHRSKQMYVGGKRTGYYGKRGYGRYKNTYRSGSALRNPGTRHGARHHDRGRHHADRGHRNNRNYARDRGRYNDGHRGYRRDGYRGGRDYGYRGGRDHRYSKHHRKHYQYPGGKRYAHNVRRYDRYGKRNYYRDYGFRGGYDGFRRHHRRGGNDYYRDIMGGALVISSGPGYQDPYYDDPAYATTVPVIEGDCSPGEYCTIRLGEYFNSPKIITLYDGKENPVEQLEGDVDKPPVN
ncbi:MAG: hypothetical protein AAF362_07570 [Pseudomonadota bacterium]